MEQSEIEVLVGEAETRVERLRSLYDQYFMGIEKIEPQTARKDVERRIQILRRAQIRNTALRFRFQNVLLRYNTFSAHWMRICRQIEDGTYKHHLRKAKARFSDQDAARESREARKRAAALEYGDTEPPGPPEFELDEGVDVDIDFDGDGGAPSASVDAPDVRAALRSYSVPGDVIAPSVAGRALQSLQGPSKAGPRDPSRDKSTEPAPPPAATVAPAKPPPVPGRGAPPPVPGKPPPPPVPAAKAGPPPVPGKPPPPPVPNRAPGPPGTARNAPATVPAPPAAARPGASPAAGKPPPPLAAKPTAPPPVAARPVPGAAGARPAPKPAEGAGADDRTRATYSKYVEMRKALGESTSSISMDSFAKSLRDSTEKLAKKHPGKTVDFDVQVKDGKTVLKPIVR